MLKHQAKLFGFTFIVFLFLTGCKNPLDNNREPDDMTKIALYLDRSPGNTPSNPITLPPVKLNSQSDWEDLLAILASKGKYVNLDISPGIGMDIFNPGMFPHGADLIVSLVLPAGTSGIIGGTVFVRPFIDFINLKEISGNNIETLGNYSFYGSRYLETVEFPALTIIGNNAFSYCYMMTGITIPGSVTAIGAGAFSGCQSLTNVTFAGEIDRSKFSNSAFNGDLHAKYFGNNGGPGTYSRTRNGTVWTKHE